MYSNEHLMFDQDQTYYPQLPAHTLAAHAQTQTLQQQPQQPQHQQYQQYQQQQYQQQNHHFQQQHHQQQQPLQGQMQQVGYDPRHMEAPATHPYYQQQQQQQGDPLYSNPYHSTPSNSVDAFSTVPPSYYSLPYLTNSSTTSSASSNNTVTTNENHGSISSSNSMPTSLYQQAPASPSLSAYNQQYSYKPVLKPNNSLNNYQQLQSNYLLQPSIHTTDSTKLKVKNNDIDLEYPKNANNNNPKRSKISGIIYNSSAVYKRLSPINSKVTKTMKITSKSQGRPFNNNLNSRLLLHSNIKTLMTHVDKRNENEFIVYDWTTPIIDSGSVKVKQSLLNLLSDENDLMSEDFRIDLPDASDIDNLLHFKHSGILRINGYKENYDPLTANVKYEAKNWSKFDDIELNKKLRQINIDFIDEVINSNNKFNSDLLVNDGNEISSDMQNSYNSNNNGIINFHKLVVAAFGADDYVFVKIIRDNNGHILKLETIKPPSNKNGVYEYTPQWVKRYVCYPRYKGGMNLHLLRQNHEDFILYNNFKMLIWDLKQGIGTGDEYGNKTLTDTVRANLFANKKVYINILKT